MIDGLDDRLKTFLEGKTYTWLKDFSNFNFNGFIKEIETNKFCFLDDELGEIWFNKEEIIFINFSKKEKKEGENGTKED